MSSVIIALLLSLTYVRLHFDQPSIQDRFGLLVFCIMLLAFTTAGATIGGYALERLVVEHEYANNTYSLLAYTVSKFLAELPFQFLFPLIFCTITYWVSGLQIDFTKFVIFVVTIFLVANIGQAIGLVVGTLITILPIAVGIMPMLIIPFVIYGGFFLNKHTAPDYFVWIQYISFFFYGMEILSTNEFSGLKFTCKNGTTTCIPTGEAALEIYDFQYKNIGPDFGCLVAIFIVLRILLYFILTMKLRKTK